MVFVMVAVRFLDNEMPAIQSAFLRYLFGLILILPFFLNEFRFRKYSVPWLKYAIRGSLHGFAVVLWFFSVVRIPMADVTAINYLTPILVSIGAIIIFKERLDIQKVLAITVAILGAVLILKPGFGLLSVGKIAQLFSTILFAISYLMTKSLTKTESTVIIVFMLTLFATITLFPFAIQSWVYPAFLDNVILVLIAVLATLGHWFMTKALALAPLIVTQPVVFLQLVWSTLTGFYLFSEKIEITTFLGGALIIFGITIITYYENKNMKI